MPRAHEPSCAFASLCVLGGLTQHPKHRQSRLAAKLARFLLDCWENRTQIKYAGHDSQIGQGWEKLKYPFTDYRILKYLDVLSQVSAIRSNPRMHQVLHLLFSKRDAEGRFTAESIHRAWSVFDFGQKKVPSRWLTLLAYRSARRVASGSANAPREQ
jgi:hypothetical protein